MSKYNSFDKLIINYDTGVIPPPFCYRYSIKLIKKEEVLQVSLKLEYYDREEVTDEEIIDEGFTLDDDFEWEGKLPSIWNREIQDQLVSSNWLKNPDVDNNAPALQIRISDGGQSEMLYPADPSSWEVFSQEIIQAIFELAGKEAPLHVQFYSFKSNKRSVDLELEFEFAKRLVQSKSSTGKVAKISWKVGQRLMRYIYFFDYLPENGISTKPVHAGDYISAGDGFWYDLSDFESGRQKERAKKLVDLLKSYT